ncbi:MAG TPA: 30S ribosomal protein S5 [Firmicutes bacterium]|nr:30S ribosomal protein S5 [Bacillota bacterium]
MARREKEEVRQDDGINSKLVSVNRITKVVKGGRIMRFAALVVVGDGKGRVGIGTGKAKEVPEAIKKAELVARRSMISVPLSETTIPHTVMGKFGKSTVLMKPAPEGNGVIAGGSVRAIVELAGIKNITTKSYGSRNPINTVRAALAGLKELRSPEQIAALRGKTVEEIQA